MIPLCTNTRNAYGQQPTDTGHTSISYPAHENAFSLQVSGATLLLDRFLPGGGGDRYGSTPIWVPSMRKGRFRYAFPSSSIAKSRCAFLRLRLSTLNPLPYLRLSADQVRAWSGRLSLASRKKSPASRSQSTTKWNPKATLQQGKCRFLFPAGTMNSCRDLLGTAPTGGL